MFLGHYAVALAAKRAAPKVSLGALFLATQWLDLLWPFFLLLGIEHVAIRPGITKINAFDFYDYPWTHSLLTSLGWALIGASILWFRRRAWKEALVFGGCIASHWMLDALVHRPDLPLLPYGTTKVGLGIWYSFWGTTFLEAAFLGVGVLMYLRTTYASNWKGRWGLWGLIGFLLLIWVFSMTMPPPSDPQMIALSMLSLWLFVPFAAWVDLHRKAKPLV